MDKAKHKLGIFILSKDNPELLKTLIDCFPRQRSQAFDLYIVDNASTDQRTLNYLKQSPYTVTLNDSNIPVNHNWNTMMDTGYEYTCILNNDLRLPDNFTEDIIKCMDSDPSIGICTHATNHTKFTKMMSESSYTAEAHMRQGWAFTVRRQAYEPIPKNIKWFYGDDWLYVKAREKNFKTVTLVSSPIVHYQGRTPRTHINTGEGTNADLKVYLRLALPEKLRISKYSRVKPSPNYLKTYEKTI
jgi:hypothetical protein